MTHRSFISKTSAWDYIKEQMNSVNENSTEKKTIIWNKGLNEEELIELTQSGAFKKIFEDETHVARQFVILMGGPSTGKGFLVYTKFGEQFGLVNGQLMKDWLDIDTISMKDVHEGDSVLREIQKGIAIISFNRLYNASLAAGRKGFDAAIKEIFYTTKDGNTNKLSDHITYKDFMSYVAHANDLGGEASVLAHDIRINKKELRLLNSDINSEEEKREPNKEKISELNAKIKELKATVKNQRHELKKVVGDLYFESVKSDEVLGFSDFINEKRELPIKQLKSILNQTRSAEPKSEDAFDEFYEGTKAQFWKSMRGWKRDGAHGIERFKDAARKEFEKDIKEKPQSTKALFGGNIIVVDSPGEDVAKQSYVGECEEAEKAGYVTNIINLDPRLGGDKVSLMRLSNFTRNVDEGDRMVDDSDITGYAENIDEAIENIHGHKFPRGPVHRYFHLVKDVNDKESIVQMIGALYGAKKNKDEFVYPNGSQSEGITFRELNKLISKVGINITLANSMKKLPKLAEWWKTHVRKIIFGINPIVLYTIKAGENSSFNTSISSADILSQVNDRLAKSDDEFGDTIHDDYNKMVQSVDNWTKEYTEWTDKDTWNALKPIVDVKESKVFDFNEYIKKLND